MKNLNLKDKERESFFTRLEKYLIRSENEDDCWRWTGSKTTGGYPVLGNGRKNGALRVSRVMLNEILKMPFENAHVLHKCDNTECTNPKHLSWGTHKDNMQDCLTKGRLNKPPRMTRDFASICVIKTVDIPNIMLLLKTNTIKQISVIYKVHEETVRRLLKAEKIDYPDKRYSKNKKK